MMLSETNDHVANVRCAEGEHRDDAADHLKRLDRYEDFDQINGAYLDWQVDQFRAFVGDRLLEIGCGVGGILERLPDCSIVQSLDVEESVLRAAQRRFQDRPEMTFSLLDLATCEEAQVVELQAQRFDTVLAINVLEHIEDDLTVLQRAERILQPGGHLVVLVPAHPRLYGEYDRLDGHFRRYTKSSFRNLIGQTKLDPVRISYFNMVGAIGWWWHYRFLKRSIHGATQFGIMNRLIPVLRKLERVVSPPCGLSVVAVLQKPPVQTND